MDRHRDEIMTHCVEMFYTTIGLVPNKRRTQDQVKARASIAMALLDYGIQGQVAQAVGKDRSTIAHMKRNHKDWLLYWEGYKNMYEIAFRITRKILGKQSASEQLNNINDRIKFLQEEKKSLENQLNEPIAI